MDVAQNAAIIADAPKTAMMANVSKKSASVGNEKDKVSFSDVLNAASSPSLEKSTDDKSTTQTTETLQQQYVTMLMPLFQMNTTNTATASNIIPDMPTSGDAQAISAVAGASGLDMASGAAASTLFINDAVTPVSIEGVLKQTGSTSSGIPNAGKETNGVNNDAQAISSLAGASGLEMAGGVGANTSASNAVAASADAQTNGLSNSDGDLKLSKSEVLLPSNTDNAGQAQRTTELAGKPFVNAAIQPSSAALFKPLEAASIYQQAAMSDENRPASLAVGAIDTKTDDTAPNGGQTQHQNISPVSVLSGFQQGGQGNVATDKKALDDKISDIGDDKVESPLASFSSVMHQVSKDNQLISSDKVSQPTAQTVQDPHAVVSQIVEQARLVKGPNASEMIIKLKPEHLGELTLKVAVDNGVVSASFHTANTEVRGIIEASIQQLKHDMAQQGLKVDNVGVYAGMGQLLSDGQGETYKKQEWKQSTKKGEKDDFNEALNAIESASGVASDSGVDYRI